MKTKVIDRSCRREINNLYRPTSKYALETFNLVVLENCFTRQNYRFLPIVLKEWFALLKVEGILKIFYNPQLLKIKPLGLEKTLWWLFGKKYKILSHKCTSNSAALIIEKCSSTLEKENGINYWSFGMVTNGVRKDFIERSIKSIRDLKIPYYEIIICGTYHGKIEKDMKYIEFKERDKMGWITRKKNIIVQNAKYSNVCIFHDRILFNKDWYRGMKKYGNNFEVLSCIQKLPNGARAGDWFTTNVSTSNSGYMYRIEELDYRDWNRYTYISGQLIMIKKHIWEKSSWNETFYWQQGEDIEYSFRLTDQGFIPRFNPYSTCTTLSWRFGRLPKKQFIGDKNMSAWKHILKDVPLRRFSRLMVYYVMKVPKVDSVMKFIYPLIVNSKLYSVVKEH